ncbi:MAG: MarR family transcriptional regulator [Bacteroidota bacterium]
MDSPQLKLENQICFPLYSVSRLITKAYKPYLDKLGLTYPQYIVLLVLWENDRLTVNQISQKLLLNTNTLSPLLKRMEKLELLQRKRSDEDERSVIIQISNKGKKLKAQALPIPENLIKPLLTQNISMADVIQLKDMLNEWILILMNSNKNNNKN